MIIFKKYKIFLLAIFFLTGCSQVVDGLSLKKKDSADQFLIQKKDPLVLPPDFEKLPNPSNKAESINEDVDFDIKKILGTASVKNNKNLKSDKEKLSLEKSILKKLKVN